MSVKKPSAYEGVVLSRKYRSLIRIAACAATYTGFVVGLVGCVKVEATKTFTVAGVVYSFPAEHVDAISDANGERPYARIVPPNARFILIYSKNIERGNQQGSDVPTIVNINDVPGKYEILDTTAGKVVCEPSLREYNCGMRLYDRKVPWNVLFNRRDVGMSVAMKAAASDWLSKYRR
jgi:hypothetical protein